jgi:hypothetical protein
VVRALRWAGILSERDWGPEFGPVAYTWMAVGSVVLAVVLFVSAAPLLGVAFVALAGVHAFLARRARGDG